MKKIFLTIAITAMAFTACNRGSDAATQTDFSIYGVWRYTGGTDVEHGETWTSDEEMTISFFKDGENVFYTSDNSVWQGVLNDMGDFSYTFNPHTHFNLYTGTANNVEVQGPFAWLVVRYDSENKRLVSADHTVEQYYEWAGLASPPDLSAFIAGTQFLKIERTTEGQQEQLSVYHEFRELGNLGTAFVISSNITLKDLNFISIRYDYNTGFEYVEQVIFSIPGSDLSPDSAFVVNSDIIEIPSRAISFLDENNVKRYFYISENQDNSSLSLTEFHPQ